LALLRTYWRGSRLNRRIFPVRHIATVWVVVLVGLIFYAMAWYVFAYMISAVISGFQGAYSFPSGADAVVAVLQYLFAWHPLIVIFGWILYGFLRSTHRSYRGDYVG